MVKLAAASIGDPRVGVLDWEITSPGPSYTVHTVERLTKSSEVVLVLGNEIFGKLPQWFEAARLLSLVDVLVVSRQEDKPDLDKVIEQAGGGKKRVTWFPLNALPFSRTVDGRLFVLQ